MQKAVTSVAKRCLQQCACLESVMAKITAAKLRALLDYDPETGVFTWLYRPVSMFKDGGHSAQHQQSRWNTNYAGKPAGNRMTSGYVFISVCGCRDYAHRLAWLYVTGEYPNEHIDHVNGIRWDNRLVNLRAVSQFENAKNQRLRSTNTSGTMGVAWHRQRGKWGARIMVAGRNISLGLYTEKDAAIKARREAEARYNFHKNHGSLPLPQV